MADFYRAEKVNDRVTAILSLTGEIMYLVNGSERSLLIDTCVGAGNLRDFVENSYSTSYPWSRGSCNGSSGIHRERWKKRM